ncbi:phosphoribosyltransferase [Methanolobus bombayensis]|uniref:phosphoribosyltransferase n=1 Tax=Methanolobus bombayensis TaxID=38023 RepID=UPI001AEB9D41|nr:phosphoribosyltransferase [Methanolobus bombayensis]MBP1908455.1 putative phosphoribosyltransferase [Methanolobus bombayensis]
MFFIDRKDAGKKLAHELERYKDKDVLVLAIPRGGVEVGCEVAKYLHSSFSLLVTRKLPFPDNPESGFGAIAEDGSIFVFSNAALWLSQKQIDKIMEEQTEEIHRRIKTLRKGKNLPDIRGRTVILIDDGLAMGSTMRASIALCKNKDAGRIVVAVPVAGGEVVKDIGQMVDEIVVLESPPDFRAVAQVYLNWYDVSDSEVLKIMESGCGKSEKTEFYF